MVAEKAYFKYHNGPDPVFRVGDFVRCIWSELPRPHSGVITCIEWMPWLDTYRYELDGYPFWWGEASLELIIPEPFVGHDISSG